VAVLALVGCSGLGLAGERVCIQPQRDRKSRAAKPLVVVAISAMLMLSGCGEGVSTAPADGTDAGTAASSDRDTTPETLSLPPPTAVDPSQTPTELPDAPELDPQETMEVLERASALCRGEGGMPGTTPYDSATAGTHPVLVVDGNHHDDYRSYAWAPVPEPGDGVVRLNQYSYAQLVACIDSREGLELARVCEVQSSDGTVDKDRKIKIFNAARYHVTVYAAESGELIAETNLTESEAEGCPFSVIFSGDQTVVRLYASPSEESLRTFLAPLVQP
jgi:hypothetical protein